MSTPIYYPNKAAWSSPVEVSGSGRRSYPILNDPTSYQLRRVYVVAAEYYTAAELGTAIEDDGTPLYLTEEIVSNKTAAFVHFERTYSTIPSTRSDYESYPFSLPGLAAASTFGTSVNITVAFPPSYDQMRFTIGTHGFTTSDLLKFDLKMRTGLSYITNLQLIQKPVSVTTNTVTIDWDLFDYDFVSGALYTIDVRPVRPPRSRSVTSRLTYDYILPGVTQGYETPEDIDTPDVFTIVTADGEEVDILGTTTIPTQADYEASIEAKDWLVTETYVRIWQGPIYERTIRTVRAQ